LNRPFPLPERSRGANKTLVVEVKSFIVSMKIYDDGSI